jgi:dienelactone hydrolase
MIYHSILAESHALSSASLATPLPPAEWAATLARRREQWREMLGLHPLPARTPLHATVTGVLDRGEYVVEKLHFQSFPGAYVPGNLYRPAKVSGPLPAVLYLCGHTKGKVNPPYQANPRWFGQHGYAALVLDPIQLGECQGYHAGTIFKKWYHWYSRGYTPAGIEVWNAVRALDYLQARPDVDPQRLGVTGLSGGGAISWFLAAADERVACCVPVCQTGTIEQHALDRTVDGHCDCAFWINLQRWCTPDLGALIAPRPLLIASGTEDEIWRPYAFRDVAQRVRAQYAALGAGERCALVEDVSPHGYTPRLRHAIFRWFHDHLKGDSGPISDDVTEVVEPEENLLVFGGNLPQDDRMRLADRLLLRTPRPQVPASRSAIGRWRRARTGALIAQTFRHTRPAGPPRLGEVRSVGASGDGFSGQTWVFMTADGIELRAHLVLDESAGRDAPLVVFPRDPADERIFFSQPGLRRGLHALTVDVRGTGATAMGPGMAGTARRLYMNLGLSLPERQVHDLLAALALVGAHSGLTPSLVAACGRGVMAPQAIYAALLEPRIGALILDRPPVTHDDPDTAEFLAVLQLGDLPQHLALAVPRPVTFVGTVPDEYAFTRELYARAGAVAAFGVVPTLADWVPPECPPT